MLVSNTTGLYPSFGTASVVLTTGISTLLMPRLRVSRALLQSKSCCFHAYCCMLPLTRLFVVHPR